jgi:poly(beta-D-mannuronate) lyase
MAEIASVQGIDLYGRSVDGKSLHDAVGFLVRAADEPELVLPYAQENQNAGTSQDWREQDLSFLQVRGHGRHYMAWAEPYRARFPQRSEAKALTALLDRWDPNFQPAIDDYSGGNMSCFFGSPPAVITAGHG